MSDQKDLEEVFRVATEARERDFERGQKALLHRAIVAETELAAYKKRLEMRPAFILAISRSQQMALVSLIGEYMRMKDVPQEFVDCSTNPPTPTNTGNLLTLVMTAPTSVGVLVDELVYSLEKETLVVNLVQAQRDQAWEQLKAAGITPKL